MFDLLDAAFAVLDVLDVAVDATSAFYYLLEVIAVLLGLGGIALAAVDRRAYLAVVSVALVVFAVLRLHRRAIA